MKLLTLYRFILPALLILGASVLVRAQDEGRFSENPPAPQTAPQTARKRPNLFRELGLSPEQLQQIKQLNQEKKPLMQAAQQRQREANLLLDQAIYADNVSESEIQMRLKDVQNAHAEVLRIRTGTETAVRRLLTPEQLVKFRELRRQFEGNRANRPGNRQNALDSSNGPGSMQPNRRRQRRNRILNNMRNTQ